MCYPGRHPGNSHSQPELLPVRMLGRAARFSVSSEANGSGTGALVQVDDIGIGGDLADLGICCRGGDSTVLLYIM